MTISMKEVHILIQQSALDEMQLREQRLRRSIASQMDELDNLASDIRNKKAHISALRDAWLHEGVV